MHALQSAVKTHNGAAHGKFIKKLEHFVSRAAKNARIPIFKAILWGMAVAIPLYACQSEAERAKNETKAILAGMRVSGWTAEIDLPMQGNFFFSFSNNRCAVHGFVGAIDIQGLMPFHMSVLLTPLNTNRITLVCYSPMGYGPSLAKIDTIIIPKTYRVDTVGNIIVLYEHPVDRKKASLAIREYASVPVERKYRRLAFAKSLPEDISNGAMFSIRDSTSYIPLSEFSDTLSLRLSAYHESAHDFFETEMDSFGKNTIKGYHKAVFVDIKAGNMIGAIFKESSYLNQPYFGHPQDDPSEFFASVSTVMHFFPEQLARKISELEKVDSAQADLARDACLWVKSAFVKFGSGEASITSLRLD